MQAFYLNGSYYDDVVEERSCIEVCGYPLCNNKVKKSNQKYHISTKQNKVFDITERKVQQKSLRRDVLRPINALAGFISIMFSLFFSRNFAVTNVSKALNSSKINFCPVHFGFESLPIRNPSFSTTKSTKSEF